MSLKQLKSSKDIPINPKSSVEDFIRAYEKKWRNTWSFNLHSKIHLGRDIYDHSRNAEMNKKMMKKFYGKKILYVKKPKEVNALVSHFKMLKDLIIYDEELLTQSHLFCKGNMVILANALFKNGLLSGNRLLCKKILKNFKKAQILIESRAYFKSSKYFFAIKDLFIRTSREFHLHLLGGIVRNMLNLETIKVEMVRLSCSFSGKSRKGFFASLHKLSHVKRVKLIIDCVAFRTHRLKKEFDELYSKPFNFDFSIHISIENLFEGEGILPFRKFLNAAEDLSLNDSREYQQIYDPPGSERHDEDHLKMVKEEKRIMKLDKKNCVKISNETFGEVRIDVAKVLSYCDSLEHLYIKERCLMVNFGTLIQSDIKGFEISRE